MSLSVTTIDLLRHGETTAGHVFCGQLDVPLSENGWAQMYAALSEQMPWQRIISSPLRRCAEFADAFAARHRLPVEREPRWQEMSFGEWEGRSAAELMERDPEALNAFWQDPALNPPPGGESLLDFHARVLEAWVHWLTEVRHEHCLVIAHGGVMRLLIAHILGMPLTHLLRVNISHAGLARLEIDTMNGRDYTRLVSLKECS